MSERAKANGPRYSKRLRAENARDAATNTVADVKAHNLEGAIARSHQYMPVPPKRESNGKGAIEVERMERRRAVWDKPKYWPQAWFEQGATVASEPPKLADTGSTPVPCAIPEPEAIRMIGHTGSEATATEVKRRFEYPEVSLAYEEFAAARRMTNVAWAKVYKQGTVYVTEYGFNGHCPKLLTLRDARTPHSWRSSSSSSGCPLP